MKTQRQAVNEAVRGIVGDMEGKVHLTIHQRQEVIYIVTEGFNADEVTLSEAAKTKFQDPKLMKNYVSGLVSNWLRKDPDLNGGIKYTPTNPGSRTGQGDPQIKELRKLLFLHKGGPEEAKIQAFIDARVQEITKTKVIEINIDDLPEELKSLVS